MTFVTMNFVTGCISLLILCNLATPANSFGCKPRNRDLRADSRLNIGILHRPPECSKRAENGDTIRVHFEARLFRNCEKFDSTRDKGDPHGMTVGDGTAIRGFERGVLGMCEGEKRKIIVPSGLAYGEMGAGVVPPGATLIYEVERLPSK
jgi:FKBP-type peptidyl-prolyl cis-trans isomerase